MVKHYGYLMRGQITGLYKVGITSNFKRRHANYKTHVPERVLLEAVKVFVSQAEALRWEQSILHQLADRIQHGEWLDLDFDQAAEIWAWGLETLSLTYDQGDDGYDLIRQFRGTDDERWVRCFRCESEVGIRWLLDAASKPGFDYINTPREITDEYIKGR